MKKSLAVILVVILIPFLIIMIFTTENNDVEDIPLVSSINVRVLRNKTNIIETISLEDYVVGVVSGEMPIYFNIEALKAQAVAARSYVLKRIEYNKNKDYDVVDSVVNQVYLDDEYLKNAWKENYNENISKIKEAVSKTENEYLEFDGVVIDALFFSTSNGYTENSEDVFGFDLPYLKSVASPWDEESSPAFKTTKSISLSELYDKLSLEYKSKLDFKVIETTSSGRSKTVSINDINLNSREVYKILGLRSTDFSLSQDGETIYIHTNGFGHGVGMSQYGANAMANMGYKYNEILSHYYIGTNLKKIV